MPAVAVTPPPILEVRGMGQMGSADPLEKWMKN